MPNWCDTTYKCVGNKKDLQVLEKIINDNANRAEPRVKNGFGRLWLGCIIDALGFDCNDYRCRGEITDYYMDDDILVIHQSTAWCEQEGFRQCIESKFPSIKVYYLDEEPGYLWFNTNNYNHKYFKEKYVVYVETDDDYYYEAFCLKKDIYEWLSKVLKCSVRNKNDVERLNKKDNINVSINRIHIDEDSTEN